MTLSFPQGADPAWQIALWFLFLPPVLAAVVTYMCTAWARATFGAMTGGKPTERVLSVEKRIFPIMLAALYIVMLGALAYAYWIAPK